MATVTHRAQPANRQADSPVDYASTSQRALRLLALTLLILRHSVRVVMVLWPLYFVALVPIVIPVEAGWWVLLFIFPAPVASIGPLMTGVQSDYHVMISGRILRGDQLPRILLWDIWDSL